MDSGIGESASGTRPKYCYDQIENKTQKDTRIKKKE
jgi:hypothetical protein